MKNEETSGWIALIVVGLLASACAEISTQPPDPRYTPQERPSASAITMESDYECLRVAGPPYGAFDPTRTSSPPLPGTRIVRSNAEWERLWNYLQSGSESDPPLVLPEGDVALALTIHGSTRVHTHIRRVEDDGRVVTFEWQVEGRDFLTGPHSLVMWASTELGDDYLESLVIFYPAGAAKEIKVKTLPVLSWTPRSRDEAEAVPPCPLRH